MLTNTVAVVNGKGGVGKTSITANVAAIVATFDWRVLAVDLDAQGNLAQDLGYLDHDDNDRGASLQEIFSGSTNAQLHILHDVRKGLDVVCGGEAIAPATRVLDRTDAVIDGHTLTRALASVAASYDLILMDCPPAVGAVTLLALAATRGVVVPVRGDDCSISGLTVVARQWVRVRDDLNPALSLLGVVLSQVPSGATRMRNELRDSLGRDDPNLHVFDAVIRLSPRSALDSRRFGVVAAEYEGMAKRGVTDRLAALHRGDSGKGRSWSRAATGLADDYHDLALEIIDRLKTVNAELEATGV